MPVSVSMKSKVVIEMSEQTSTGVERQLRLLGRRDDLFPETPDLAAEMTSLIRSAESNPRPVSVRHRCKSIQDRSLRPVAVVVLAILAALIVALALPTSRSAIAEFFGIEGIRIEFGQDAMQDLPGTPTSIGGSLLLGERSTLEAAMDAAPFDIVVPGDATIGEPEETYLNQRSEVTVVGMLWKTNDELPEIGSTGVGMLLLEIESEDDAVILMKKAVSSSAFETADVGDAFGFWIENAVLTVEPVEGLMLDLLEPSQRRSGNVLIWSDGETTYRLETQLPQEDTVRIAESLVPANHTGNP